jgi:hypothetical protein
MVIRVNMVWVHPIAARGGASTLEEGKGVKAPRFALCHLGGERIR